MQPTGGAVADFQLAAVTLGNVSRYAQTETKTLVLVFI
jgi:hypothetical protein